MKHKYIDAQELMDRTWRERNAMNGKYGDAESRKARDAEYTNLMSLIGKMPAADVEPVRRGEWMPRESMAKSGKYEKEYVCSACHKYYLHFGEWRDTHKYCPNCGAKMDGGNT